MGSQTISLFDWDIWDIQSWEIKKHSSLVQMGNITTLRERKVLNTLIYIAKDFLKRNPEEVRFSCDIGTIKRLAGRESSNTRDLKQALTSLVETSIEYNVLNKDSETRWVFSLLAEATIKEEGSGKPTTIKFEFPSTILKAIKHPRIYVKLNLLMLRWFTSKHSLALYEFLVDYINISSLRCHIQDFRKLMGIGESQYRIFTMLRKRVLDVAITEINEKSDISASYTLEKVGRRVEYIIFSMQRKKEALDEHNVESAIRDKLKSFGLWDKVIEQLLERHDEAYLRLNISVVEEQYKKGKVKNLAGYLLKAFEDDYSQQKATILSPQEEQQAIIEAEEQEEDKKKHFEIERKKWVAKYLSVLTQEEEAALIESFLADNTDNLRLKKLQEKNDFSHPAIQAIYNKRVAKNRLPEKRHSFQTFSALWEDGSKNVEV